MRPLRYSINVALDGYCDQRELVSRLEFDPGDVAMRYVPVR